MKRRTVPSSDKDPYETIEDVLRRAEAIKGRPLGEIDLTGRLASGKGAIGTVVEESWFRYSPNNESRPDFEKAGVELKVTPYIRTKQGFVRAKERLVCNIIDYLKECDKTFETSSFWLKCRTMLFMFYEHLYGCPKSEYKIDDVFLFEFPEEDRLIIKQDWATIISKIRAGKAHELSEGDTLYLAACTKGATAADVRKQPFSDVPAKQRAYSLKASYMTQVLKRHLEDDEGSEQIIRDVRILKRETFEEYVLRRLSNYHGKTTTELQKRYHLFSRAKNINELLLAKMLGAKGRLSRSDEFRKANIVPKTIRVQRNGRIKESMSFPAFDFIALINEEDWESSELYNYVAPIKFLFVIFRERDDGEYVFDQARFWNIPNDDLWELGRVWYRTRDIIKRGVKMVMTPRGMVNDLPKMKDSKVAHVRPHGRNAADMSPLPDGRMMTKQCFWLNNTYIAEQINK